MRGAKGRWGGRGGEDRERRRKEGREGRKAKGGDKKGAGREGGFCVCILVWIWSLLLHGILY